MLQNSTQSSAVSWLNIVKTVNLAQLQTVKRLEKPVVPQSKLV